MRLRLLVSQAKNGLESYAYSLKNTLTDSKVDEKLDAADKEKLKAEIDKTVAWLDENQTATKDEYEAQQKELEGVANPIMMKFYGAGGEGGMPGGMPGGYARRWSRWLPRCWRPRRSRVAMTAQPSRRSTKRSLLCSLCLFGGFLQCLLDTLHGSMAFSDGKLAAFMT